MLKALFQKYLLYISISIILLRIPGITVGMSKNPLLGGVFFMLEFFQVRWHPLQKTVVDKKISKQGMGWTKLPHAKIISCSCFAQLQSECLNLN